MERYNSMLSLFEVLMRRMYSAEKQIFDHLTEAADCAYSGRLKNLFADHRKETAHQINRAEKIFEVFGFDLYKTTVGQAKGGFEKGKELVKGLLKMSFTGKNRAIDGTIEDGREIFSLFSDTEVSDLVLAMEGNTLEEAEISAYNTLCLLAEETEYNEEVLPLLKKSLEEEKKAQKALSQLIADEIKSVKV